MVQPAQEASYLDVNGPCPLIAIANVLLLRGRAHVPAGVGEISQDRLVALVAEIMLDSASTDRAGLSAEYKANMQQHLADAIALLPKLTTGIDVNVRFHDIQGFEYTNEITVFDLLGIPLVHGWLVDPQDYLTAAALGQRSYNEVVMALVTALGSAATPRQLTPTDSMRQRGGGFTPGSGSMSPPAAAGATGPPAAAPAPAAGPIDSDALAAALQHSLRIVAASPSQQDQPQPGSQQQQVGTASASTSRMSTAMSSAINHMMSDLIRQAFSATDGSGAAPAAAEAHGGALPSVAEEELAPEGSALANAFSDGLTTLSPSSSSMLQPPLDRAVVRLQVDEASPAGPDVKLVLRLVPTRTLSSPFESMDSGTAAAAATLAASVAALGCGAVEPTGEQAQGLPSLGPSVSGSSRLPEASGTAEPSTASESAAAASTGTTSRPPVAEESSGAASQTSPARASPAPASGAEGGRGGAHSASPPGAALPSQGSADVREALLMQQFLEGHSSQLTYHGLASLHEGLKDGQLAVLFRRAGRANNHFNTLLARGGRLFLLVTDQGYQFERDVVWEELSTVDGDTALVDGSFRPFVPHAAGTASSAATAAPVAEWEVVHAAATAANSSSMDADLALAMQLQAEEDERAHAEAERQRQAAAAEQRGQAAGAAPAAAARRHVVLPSQRQQQQQQQRPGSAGRRKKEKSSTDCVIM
eukprot:scaffold1.g5413.t1